MLLAKRNETEKKELEKKRRQEEREKKKEEVCSAKEMKQRKGTTTKFALPKNTRETTNKRKENDPQRLTTGSLHKRKHHLVRRLKKVKTARVTITQVTNLPMTFTKFAIGRNHRITNHVTFCGYFVRWFHVVCEGATPEDMDLEKYVCSSCQYQ